MGYNTPVEVFFVYNYKAAVFCLIDAQPRGSSRGKLQWINGISMPLPRLILTLSPSGSYSNTNFTGTSYFGTLTPLELIKFTDITFIVVAIFS